MANRIILSIVAYVLFLFLSFPLMVLIAVSFTEASYLTFPPEGFSFKWYAAVLEDLSYLDAMQYSFWLALCATLISVVIGVPAAQALARSNFAGKNLIVNLISSPLIFPQIIFGVALLQFFSYFMDKPQNFLALTIGHVVLTLPYIIRTCTATFAGIGRSVEEAAADLGANRLQTFCLVTLPLIKPGVIAGALFAFSISWINVEVTIFLTASNQQALPVKMFNYVQYNIDPTIAAVSAMTIYIAFLLIVLIDRYVGIENVANSQT